MLNEAMSVCIKMLIEPPKHQQSIVEYQSAGFRICVGGAQVPDTPFFPGGLDPAAWDGISLHTNAILEGADLALEDLS